jgi:hypothetical protein
MNILRTRTRRGAAILFSGILVLGGLTLAGEASADVPDGNPTCTSLGYEFGEKWDEDWEKIEGGTYTLDRDGMTASLTVGTYPDKTDPNKNNAIIAADIDTKADGYAVVVKGGPGYTEYENATQATLRCTLRRSANRKRSGRRSATSSSAGTSQHLSGRSR